MDNKDKNITFLIAQRGKPHNGNTDFFDTFDGAVNFKREANVVVLEDTTALKLVLENFPESTEFRLLIHANIGEEGKEEQTKKLRTVVGDVQSIHGCVHINPFFITRSGEIEKLCISENKCFVKLKKSEIMCSHTSKLSDNNFLKELLPFCKKMTGNDTSNSNKPKIFIGSSSHEQALKIAKSIKNNLSSDIDSNQCQKYSIRIWNEGLFEVNNTNIENLESILSEHDYGIFVFNGDDEIYKRNIDNKEVEIPRDNVIFEYGMFMGKHTRKKVFFIVPKPIGNLKIMSDLLGIKPLDYDTTDPKTDSAVGVACNKIREIINGN